MKAIHRKRLLKLAAFLAGPVARAAKRNHAEKLNMGSYANAKRIGLTKQECSTSACALGWATVVFPRQFKLRQLNDGSIPWVYQRGEAINPEMGGKFFGLDDLESQAAFGSVPRTIPQEVAILRKLAAGK